jgi:2,3-bisphosphoglycerate-independent phosphoglycerate mutase
MPKRPRPLVLTILDGWGHREEPENNAIAAASTPRWDDLLGRFPNVTLHTDGDYVGLPNGQMGNSEVGHLNLGAGRIVYQDLSRITLAISDGSFAENPVLTEVVDAAVTGNGAVHILGLASPGGVHSHEDHLFAMIRLAAARGARRIRVHAMLDGRDMPPRSAAPTLARLASVYAELTAQYGDDMDAHTATLVGRYFAMDRDARWDRVQRAWSLFRHADAGFRADSAADALEQAYSRGENDEFVQPTVIGAPAPIADGDAVVFMNFRADRARQITRAFVDEAFDGFERGALPALAGFACLTEYAADIPAPVAFPNLGLANTLGEFAAVQGLRQLRCAETEKYAHVTFFFNGGREAVFENEDRVLIDSPRVATYDLAPAMSAQGVTDALVGAIESGDYDLIICNYANADMVGHTGIFEAAVQAVEALDACIGVLSDAVLAAGGEMLITADHGNVEQMADANTGQAHTAHTNFVVPLVYVGARAIELEDGGRLCDVAPSLVKLLDLPQPAEMTGRPLIRGL